jgi:autophagy-related protein 2
VVSLKDCCLNFSNKSFPRLEQLSVDLYNGTGSVSNLNLDLSSLNDQLASVGVAIEVLDGFVRNIKVEIPWSNLMKDSCTLTLRGLELTIQMAEEVPTMQGMCESLFQTACTMTTSIEIAEKVVQDTEEETEGLDSLAQYIENILARVKLCLYDTVLRVERGKEENLTRMEIRIKKIEYSDEQNDGKDDTLEEEGQASIYMKKVSLSGATFWHDKKKPGDSSDNADSPDFVRRKSPGPESPPSSPGSYKSCSSGDPMEALADPFALIGEIMGTQEVRVRIQPRTGVNAPKLWLDANFQPFCFFVSPSQVHSVLDLVNELAQSSQKSSHKAHQNSRPIHFDEFGKIEEQVFEDVDQDSETDEEKPMHFQPGSQEPQFYSMYGSGATSAAPSMASSQMTASGSSTASGGGRRNNFLSNQVDPNYGGYQYSFKVSSLSITVLHNDPVSDFKMREMAQEHFEKMRELQSFGLVNRTMGDIASEIHNMSKSDRLTIFAFPLSGSVQQSGLTGYQREALQLHAQMGQLWIWEHLYNGSVLAPDQQKEGLQIPILKFRQDMHKSLLESLPEYGYCVRVNISQTRSRSSLRLELGRADFEFDPSIIDRISRLLSYQPPQTGRRRDPQSHDSLIADLSRPDQRKLSMEINVSAQDLSLKLRIPIPDRRDELHRAPWYQRRVRDEILKVDLHSLTISISKANSVNLSIKDVQLFFLNDEWDLSTPPCIQISSNDDGRTIVFPSIMVETKPAASKIAQSMYSSFHQYAQSSPQTPFSSQRTSYGDENYRQSVEAPANAAELEKFRRNLYDSSLTFVKLSFPKVRIDLLSNKFYEKLFNRLAWDLAMWKPVTVASPAEVHAPRQVFFDLDTDEDDGELPPVHRSNKGTPLPGTTQPTPIAIELDIEDGEVVLNCRQTNNSPGPEIHIDISSFKLIFAGKYLSGVADYIYISAQTLTIKHRPDQCAEFTAWVYPKFEEKSGYFHRHRESENEADPMIKISLKLENEEDERRLAHYTVAVGLSNTSVRYRMVKPGQAPWEHLGVLFNVQEELPVGYEPPAYVTSLHVSLKDIFLDYRPLYTSECAILSIDSFTLSTVLRPNSKVITLSMIGEYIAVHMTRRQLGEGQRNIDLKNDW